MFVGFSNQKNKANSKCQQPRWDPKEQPSLVYNGFGNPTQATGARPGVRELMGRGVET